LEGRDFTEGDGTAAPGVTIVNETFARRFFGGRSPVGGTLRMGDSALSIVGEVKDSKYDTPTESKTPYFYLPFRQSFSAGLNFAVLVRTVGDPMRVVPELRRQALALNQDAAFRAVRLADAVGYSLYVHRVAASLLTVVAAVCLLLAALGLYSVISYAVSQRRQEFGIRMALGAGPWDVVRMVARQSLQMALPGLLAGVLSAVAAARLVSGMLVGVSVADPLTLAASAVFLVAVALVASSWPARRAVAVDPMRAVRSQ
ncbi:MAG TPA: FtsX-like permease family protein, partial [Vicinamibacteria bacterium]|nr:FtsX-like permease family protein [Vicinamibacteria bacterium]